MGSNHSKMSFVPDLHMHTRLLKQEQSAVSTFCRIGSLQYSTTTPERDLIASLECTQNKPWLSQLLERGRPEGFRPDLNFTLNSALLVALMGSNIFFELAGMKLSIEARAATVMWIMEEKTKNPWKTLWAFLNTACRNIWGVKSPRKPIGALLSSEDVHPIQILDLATKLMNRLRDTFQDCGRLVCAACGRMAINHERFRSCPCKAVYYCSEACHQQHWPHHRLECTAVKDKKTLR